MNVNDISDSFYKFVDIESFTDYKVKNIWNLKLYKTIYINAKIKLKENKRKYD